jgi:hypothetical protein
VSCDGAGAQVQHVDLTVMFLVFRQEREACAVGGVGRLRDAGAFLRRLRQRAGRDVDERECRDALVVRDVLDGAHERDRAAVRGERRGGEADETGVVGGRVGRWCRECRSADERERGSTREEAEGKVHPRAYAP